METDKDMSGITFVVIVGNGWRNRFSRIVAAGDLQTKDGRNNDLGFRTFRNSREGRKGET